MLTWSRVALICSATLAVLACHVPLAAAVTSEQLSKVPVLDDLQRNDPAPNFSSVGVNAGKWSTPTAWVGASGSRGKAVAYSFKGELWWAGYGSSSSGPSAAYWNAQQFSDTGNGVAVEATLTLGASSKGETLAVWLNQPSPTTTISGYELVAYYGLANPYRMDLIRWEKGGPTTLLGTGAVSLTPSVTSGSTLALAEQNGQVSAWIGTAGKNFSKLWEGTDPSPFKSGYAGLYVSGTPLLDNFSAGSLPPAAPTLSSTSPISPGSTTSPKIVGSAGAGMTVKLYTNSSCTGSPIATGSAATFASPGITATVAEGSTTTFYATATNAESVVSGCSSGSVTYEQIAPNIYWGSWTKTATEESPFNMTLQSAFEEEVGKTAALIHWSSPFYSSADCGGYCGFQTSSFNAVRSHGSIPFFSWAPNGLPWQPGAATDKEIAGGKEDSYIEAWANAAKSWGHPLFLRFAWEMNGSWFPWGIGYGGQNTAAQYVEMWQHVHDIFVKNVGATNVSWVWCPNIDPNGIYPSMSSLYPGNEYVDWTCLDGYNAGQTKSGNDWKSFSELFSSSYSSITGTIASSKPMIVGETASTEEGGSKAEWITSALGNLSTSFPKIHGLLWFDKVNEEGPGEHTDWPIESSPSATAAFANAIQGGPFVNAKYSGLNTSPIPLP